MSDHLRPHYAALERLRALHPRKIDLSLGRMRRLLAALGHPERRLPPVVHVAGTNGKGSTIAFLRAMAEADGRRVHVFTSPHLVRFAERIRLTGRLIEEEALAEVLARVEAANAGESITFFEITAAAALVAFSEVPADLLLLEVGLGGRWDATNVVDAPALSIITPVDLDHREFLGDTVTAIAGEKAGVLKAGRPAVVAPQRPEALAVIEAEAARVGAPLVLAGRDFRVAATATGLGYDDEGGGLALPPPSLMGAHQVENAAVAVAAARALGVGAEAIAAGMAGARWPARMQRLTAGPLAALAQARGADLWLDGAHNVHAARAVAKTLADMRAADGRPLAVVLGLLANKDAAGVMAALSSLRPLRLVTTAFDAEAAADPADLAAVATTAGLPATAAADVVEAVTLALDGNGDPPHLVICGSLYLAGEVLALSPDTWPD